MGVSKSSDEKNGLCSRVDQIGYGMHSYSYLDNRWAISLRREGYNKGTRYLLIYFFCVQRHWVLCLVLTHVENTGVITRVPTSRRWPRLSHLFFADNRLLFCKANSVEWRRLTKILDRYEMALGKKLNKERPPYFFLVIPAKLKGRKLLVYRVWVQQTNTRNILGLPTLVGHTP